MSKRTLLVVAVGGAILAVGAGLGVFSLTRPGPVEAPPLVANGPEPSGAVEAEPDSAPPSDGSTGSAALDEALAAARETLAGSGASEAVPADPAPGRPDVAPTAEPEMVAEPQPSEETAALSPDISVAGPDPGVSAPQVEASGAPVDPAAPRFDVVRVEPDGSAVMAGRAEPGASVTVLDAGRPIGQTIADQSGQWVFLPDAPLAPGDRALSLSARGGAGASKDGGGDGPARESETVVVLSLPERADDGPILALQTPRQGGGAAEVLQGPAPAMASGELSIGQVDYTSSGTVALSGAAEPGTTVQLYLNNKAVAEVAVDESGTWRATPEASGLLDLSNEVATLRVDELNAAGEVTGRVEVPFQHTDLSTLEAAEGETMVVVQPGNNLWRVARAAYGQGIDYTVIYQANSDQIRDPDLIYPGQVFRIPDAGGGGPR